jgi:hypothetical protein
MVTLIKPALHGFDADGVRRPVQAIPVHPTTCRCGAVLEPLRRFAGLCRPCVLAWAQSQRSSRSPPALQLASQFRELGRTTRARPDGRTEQYVQVECSCGRRRVLKLTTWLHHQPRCCNRCRLRDVDAHGFEAECRPRYGRRPEGIPAKRAPE